MDGVSHDSKLDFFKFRDLKVYASTEYLAGNQKKYRQVFNRLETAYIYAELSLYNKFFDAEDWLITGELRCYAMKRGRRKVCSIQINKKISKYDNVVYIREGWGNKAQGVFWKKGTYCWEFWMEGEKLASKYFYVEDPGKNALTQENNFFELAAVKLYEGPYDDVEEEERAYLKKFSSEETRYVYLELTLRNLVMVRSWQCELIFKFYNNAKELKGQVVRLQRIDKNTEYTKVTAGWGSNVKGSWRKDKYSVEVIFLDRSLVTVPFEVEENFEEGLNGVLLPENQVATVISEDFQVAQTFEELLAKLDALIGLTAIKANVRDHAKYIKFLQLRKEKGFYEREGLHVHSVFIGNPGTGKTTVAKMMGKLYKKMGLLSKGHIHEVDRSDLVGEYIGQTAPKVKEAIEKARGGVLFIDEAYALARSNEDSKDFGREVIEILVKEMSNGPGDLAVIVAGYPKEMKHFLDANPGLKSRFKLHFEFSDYLPQELSQIANYACREKGVKLTTTAREKINEIIVEAFRKRDRSFGNARFVFDLIERAKINLGLRVMNEQDPSKLSNDELSKLELIDVERLDTKQSPPAPHIPVDERLLEEALGELNKLIGLAQVKSQIKELVSLVRYYRETNKDVLNRFFLHTVFVGNPGTGKTTVARILAKIYKALGVLERGHMVETDRQGLIAGYVGQTATKTAEKIEEAMGGVHFIDEAYALPMKSSPRMGDIGEEAIQALLKRMEDRRGEFFVFAAGYPDNMEHFLKANPGLSSRFDKILKFDDYTPKQLLQIALMTYSERDLSVSPGAEKLIERHLEQLFEKRDRYFGNARTIRAFVDETVKRQNLRLASIPLNVRSDYDPHQITSEDISTVDLPDNELTFNRKQIGFRAMSNEQ